MGNIVTVHLAKLQSALLDGRISQEQYEQLKSDMLASASLSVEIVESEPMSLCPNGEGQPLTLKPCSPEDYNAQWEWIKGRLIDHGLSYMIDTDAKINKVAKSIGFLLGYGEEKLAWRIVSWLLLRERP